MNQRELSCRPSLDHAPKVVSLRGHDGSWHQPRQPRDMPTDYSTKRSIKRFPRAIHLPSRAILMRREGICVNDGPVCTENLIRIDWLEESPNVVSPWLLWYRFLLSLVGLLLKPKSRRLEAESAEVRH